MVVLWVIIIFLVSTCSTDDFKQSMCGRFEMTKEVISKDAFYGTLRKTYKNASVQGLCAQLCYGDDRCNGILVSPDTCYLFGVFNVTHSSLPQVEYDSCDVFKMVSITHYSCSSCNLLNMVLWLERKEGKNCFI